MFDLAKPLIDKQSIRDHVQPPEDDIAEEKPQILNIDQSQGVNLITLFSAIILGLFVIASAGTYLMKLSRESTLKNRQEAYNRLNTQLNSPELKKVNNQVISLTKGANKAKQILNDRFSFGLLLSSINNVIPNNIVFTSLQIDDKQKISISASADNDQTVSMFLAILDKSDKFSNANLSALSFANNGVTFSITLDAKSDKFAGLHTETISGSNTGGSNE